MAAACIAVGRAASITSLSPCLLDSAPCHKQSGVAIAAGPAASAAGAAPGGGAVPAAGGAASSGSGSVSDYDSYLATYLAPLVSAASTLPPEVGGTCGGQQLADGCYRWGYWLHAGVSSVTSHCVQCNALQRSSSNVCISGGYVAGRCVSVLLDGNTSHVSMYDEKMLLPLLPLPQVSNATGLFADAFKVRTNSGSWECYSGGFLVVGWEGKGGVLACNLFCGQGAGPLLRGIAEGVAHTMGWSLGGVCFRQLVLHAARYLPSTCLP